MTSLVPQTLVPAGTCSEKRWTVLGVGDLQGAAGLPLEEGEELEWGGSAAQGPRSHFGGTPPRNPLFFAVPRTGPARWQACG